MIADKQQQKKSLSLWTSLSGVFLLGLLFVVAAQPARASISKTINYQGRLNNGSGTAVSDGPYDMVFKIYTVAGGGAASWTESWTNSALWTEAGTTTVVAGTGGNGCSTSDIKITYSTTTTQASLKAGQTLWNTTQKSSAVIDTVTTASTYICAFTPAVTWNSNDNLTNRAYVKGGIFSLTLGTVTALTTDFTGGNYYLGVTVGTDSEMSPRKPLTAVPQAINTNNLSGDGSISLANTATTGTAAAITTDSLSSGYGLSVSSASTTLTGNVASITSSGSAAGVTGNTLQVGMTGASAVGTALNVTHAGTAGYALRVNDDGTYTDSTPFVVDYRGYVGVGLTAPTALLSVGASTTTRASLNIAAGAAPTTPNNGDLWYSAGHLYFQDTTTKDLLAGAGMSIGGSITSATAGSILFAGTSGVLAQDNANFYWNDTSDYLRLGNASAQYSLGLDASDSNKFKIYQGSGVAGTNTFSIDTSGVTTVGSLNLGSQSFASNAGIVSWMDLPVTSAAANGTAESYTAQLDGNPMLTVYGQADGSGGIKNTAIGIGTTNPGFTLDVVDTTGTGSLFALSNADFTTGVGSGLAIWSGAPTGNTFMEMDAVINGGGNSGNLVLNRYGGNVGIGVTGPTALMSLAGSTTAGASLNIAAGTAPTAPNNGDMWYVAGHLYFRDTTTKDLLAGGGMAIGGTITNSPNNNSLLFVSSGTLGQDVNLTWDATNDRLAIGQATPNYKLDIATATASDRAINITDTAATGTNYGIYDAVSGAATANYGGYFNVTGAATDYGLFVNTMSGATANTGLSLATASGISGNGTNRGIDIGAITGSGTDAGINIAALTATGANEYGINIGGLSGNATINTGMYIGTVGGGATTTTKYGMNLAGITGTAASANTGINVGAISGSTGASTNTGLNITSVAGAATNAYGINLGNVSGATTNYGINFVSTSASGTNYGTYASLTGAATTNTGAYYVVTGATIDYGIQVAAMTGATSTGLNVVSMSGATSTGVAIGAMTGSTNYGLNLASITATGGGTNAGVNIGNISGSTSGNNYGIQIGTIAGTGTSNNGISIGSINSGGATNSYGINIAGFGTYGTTTTYGINVGANTSTGTASYGMKIAGPTGVATSNYGLDIAAPSGATHNSALTLGAVVTTAGTWALYSNMNNNSYFAGNVGFGVTGPTAAVALAASTATRASLNIATGVAPTAANVGDLWYDGTNLYFNKTGGTLQNLLASGGGGTLQTTYAAGNSITTTSATDVAFILANVATATKVSITNQDTAATSAEYINNSIASGTLANGLQFENTGAGTVTNAISILDTAGTVTTGLNIGNGVTTGITIGTGTTTGISIASGGIAISAGALAINNATGITSNQATLNINPNSGAGTLAVAGALTSTLGVSISAGQSYTGAGAVTVSSGGGAGLTFDSASNTDTFAASDTTITASGVTTLTLGAGVSITNASGNITLQPAGASTTATVQVGAGGSGSTTPDLLGLDVKSSSGDPAGASGDMYYNSNTGRFRCDVGGTFVDCASGSYMGTQVITSGTSYTPSTGTKTAVVELWGGGGGGGGVSATAAGAGGGGGSGGYALYVFNSVGAGPYTVAIGTAGTATSGAAGGAGGSTTFNTGSVLITAKGGSGGGYVAGSTTQKIAAPGAGAAVSTNGTINGAGVSGTEGFTFSSASFCSAGQGGSTSLGGGGAGQATVTAAGIAAVANTGSGGGGACAIAATAAAGGTGAAGFIRVYEFR